MAKYYRVLIGIFLAFIGIVTFILLILLMEINPVDPGSNPNDASFPFVIFIAIFLGGFISIAAAVLQKKR
ncbi:MAG: hypothetical protein ACXAC8_16955 [Candidatus Hodarchaeales archaeon]